MEDRTCEIVMTFWCPNSDLAPGELFPHCYTLVPVETITWERRNCPFFTCGSLCSDLVILVVSLFAFSALVLAFQCFTRKHCLQILGLGICTTMSNQFPILKNLLMDSNLSPFWRLVT